MGLYFIMYLPFHGELKVIFKFQEYYNLPLIKQYVYFVLFFFLIDPQLCQIAEDKPIC